jgi:hypothetical protein
MKPVYLPEPDSFWGSLRRALENRRVARRRRRQAEAAAIVTACWPDKRPPHLNIG